MSSLHRSAANLRWWRTHLLIVKQNSSASELKKSERFKKNPSRAICSKQTTLSIAVRRFWIASCLAMLPNKLCSWRNKAASASYSPKRKERDLARNRAKSLELQDVSFKIPKKISTFDGFFGPLRNSSTQNLPANGIIWGSRRASLRGWNSVGFQDTPGGPMFIQHDEAEVENKTNRNTNS